MNEQKPIFINESLNDDSRNVFEFIDSKLAFGVGEWDYYLTKKGEYVVEGCPFCHNWYEYGLRYGDISEDDPSTMEEFPKERVEEIMESYNESKEKWLEDAGVTEEDLNTLELLHKQYLAIVEYSKNPDDEEAINTIPETYNDTGINCLKYLASLKTEEQWHQLGDLQGTQLCAVITGYDPNPKSNSEERKVILSKMHNAFVFYTDEIDRIVSEKSITR